MRRLKNSSTSPGLPTVNSPAFSRKKGRFSGKNRLKRSRFTCWSSTSTCAKSVFTVPSRARLGVTVYFTSPPTSPSRVPSTGLGPDASALASAYGMTFRLRSTGTFTPESVPASDRRYRSYCRGIGAQYARSLRRRMFRWKFTPHTWSAPCGNRRVLNGMANSADHPLSEIFARTCHAPSQLMLKPPPAPLVCVCIPLMPPPPCPSLVDWPSYSMPAGLVPNTNPFWRSR